MYIGQSRLYKIQMFCSGSLLGGLSTSTQADKIHHTHIRQPSGVVHIHPTSVTTDTHFFRQITHLDVSSAGAHGEDGEVLRGLQPAEHEGAEDGGEWAPATASGINNDGR